MIISPLVHVVQNHPLSPGVLWSIVSLDCKKQKMIDIISISVFLIVIYVDCFLIEHATTLYSLMNADDLILAALIMGCFPCFGAYFTNYE